MHANPQRMVPGKDVSGQPNTTPWNTRKPQTVYPSKSCMPELPEVQTIINTLAPRVAGARILQVAHLRADMVHPPACALAARLTGHIIKSIHRRAKRIIFTLADGSRFYIHLGMTGRLTLEPPDAPIQKHTHFILEIGCRIASATAKRDAQNSDTRLHLRLRDVRRFGGIFWLGTKPTDTNLGPEPLTLRTSQLTPRLARTTRAIKNALLDQKLIAGLGNIYVDESLHAAQIHPLTPANRLTPAQIARLTRSIKQVLKQALRHRGSTLRDYVDAEGGKGAFQKLHRAYDREGLPCPRCKTLIKRIVLGGRSTCFCPRCQPRRARTQSATTAD